MAETPPETRPEMRPVIAHALHRLDRAGAEVLAAGLARDLRDRFRFVFLCLDGLGAIGEALRDEGFVVETLERRPGIDRALAKRLRQRLRHHRVDLVHAHQYTPFFYAALARGAMPIGNKHPPILFTEHGRHVPDRRSTKRVFANKLLLRPADRVTAVGRFVKQALVENEGIPDRRVDVVYNGIAPGPPPTDDDRRQARERLGLDADRSLVVHVARFHPVKDHATAIRAWAKLHNDLPEALLVLVGDGERRPEIEALVNELNLQDAVRFTGAVDHARQLIPAADLAFLSSLSEGVSITLLEAMAAGVPVVATDVGGNPEVVDAGRTGLLVPSQDPDALATALGTLLDNAPYVRRTLGQAGRERLEQRFTAERMHADYAQRYESMARDPQS